MQENRCEYELMKYKLANDALNIALWDMDVVSGDPVNPSNKFIWSQEFRHMLGFSDENDFPNVLQSWSDRLHPEDKAAVLSAFAAHLTDYSGKTPYDFEYRLMLKNGQYRYFHALGNTLRNATGVPLRVAGAVMDITEKKRMAEALEHRDNLLDAVNHAASVMLTTKEETFESSLLYGMETMGYSVGTDRVYIMKNELINGELHFVYRYEWINEIGRQGTNINKGTTVPYSFDAEWSIKFHQGECMNGQLHSLSPNIQKFFSRIDIKSVLVIPIFLQDNFWGLVSFSDCKNERIFTNDEVNILRSGALMMVNAINRSAQTAEIREGHNRTRLLLDSMPYTCHLWNKKYEMFDCNEENVRLFNLKTKQEVSEQFDKFSPEYQPDGRLSSEKAVEMIQKAFDTGRHVDEWMHQTSDGEPLPIEITLVRFAYGDDYVVAGYARDLREQKRMMEEIEKSHERTKAAMKEAQVANEAKSDFLANISHEMRTPLNAVLGLSRLTLDMENLDGEAADNLEKIHSAGSTLLNIVNDILDISKIEAGKLKLIPNKYDVPSLINDTITQNIFRIGDKLIKFQLDIGAELPAFLYGDDLRIKQILSNLLSNAFKYTKEGIVELGLRSEYVDDGKTVWMTAWVRDTGVGIRPEDIKKLFSDYSQVDTKANRKIEGTGLGLAITKKMVELMGGTIDVKSEYGKGSVFTVRYKQGFISDAPIGDTVVENLKNFRYSDAKRKQGSRFVRIKMPYAKVLIVDDNLTNLDVAAGLMKPYKLHIDCVTSGKQAIDAIRAEEGKYDAVFMDHMMPEMDGIETTQHIREIDTDYARNIPIIALTANAVEGNEKKFLSKGFQAFLSKPIDLSRLDDVLRHWVRDKEKERHLPPDLVHMTHAATDTAVLSEIPDIPGLNVQKGLDMYAGNTETYMSILRSYAQNTPAIIEQLRVVTVENLPRYAINVHGLKGSSASIGAEYIREKGLELEARSKVGDLQSILELNDAFLCDAEKLVENIKAWFIQHDKKNDKPCLDAPNPAVLEKLRQYLTDYDMNGIDDTMAELEKTDYAEDAGLIPWLKARITESDYEKAVIKLTDILERRQQTC